VSTTDNDTDNDDTPRVAYSAGEVASMLGVHHQTVRRWCERGHLESIKVGKGKRAAVLVTAASVFKLLGQGQEDET
jgi:excisionase family DNA binding protein